MTRAELETLDRAFLSGMSDGAFRILYIILSLGWETPEEVPSAEEISLLIGMDADDVRTYANQLVADEWVTEDDLGRLQVVDLSLARIKQRVRKGVL